MSSNQDLGEQLEAKKCLAQSITVKITAIELSIYKLSQKFYSENAKIQHKITKVQFSKPKGNQANQWPHCPMTPRIRSFYQIKDRKECDLRKRKELLHHIFNHDKAILTSEKQALVNEESDIRSQIRIIKIRLNQKIDLDNL